MAKHWVIGVIEMDPSPDRADGRDANVGETLRRLRRCWQPCVDESPASAASPCPGAESLVDGRALDADLDQLRADLEREMQRFRQRLLVAT